MSPLKSRPNALRFEKKTKPIKCIQKDERIEQMQLVKFREVSDSVWISLKAVIIEKTLKED